VRSPANGPVYRLERRRQGRYTAHGQANTHELEPHPIHPDVFATGEESQ